MDVAERADQNFATHIVHGLAGLAGSFAFRAPDLVLGDSGFRCDTFNIIACARLAPANTTGRIAGMLDYFRNAQRPFSWWVGPADQPAYLGELLEAGGLRPAESEQAMSVNLSELGTPAIPAGLMIRRATTAAELTSLARIHGGWKAPDRYITRYYREAAGELLKLDSPRWFYVGYVEDEPVAAAEVTVSHGVAGLYGVMVRDEYRGRGYGLALSAAPLIAARDAGADLGVLQAAEGVDGLYRRLGFTTFGDIREYKPA